MEKNAANTTNPELASGVRGSNQIGVRARNERLVLSLVRRHKALSKSEIARVTGLSAQAVSVIMRHLESDGLLLRGEPVRGKVGQPSVPMRLNPDGAFFLGLKIGRRSAELVVTDFLGTVLNRARATYSYPTPDAALSFAKREIKRLINSMSPSQRSRIAGLGIAMPFFLWDWANTLRVPTERMAAWREADIRAEISAQFDMPIFLQNDATAACGAELVLGTSQGPRDFLYFYIGYFVGGGVVLNGSIYSGRGNSGALGPSPVPKAGGGVQSLLDVASLYVLERRLDKAGLDPDALWSSSEAWDIPEPLLDRWINEAAEGLVHATVAACALIDFEAVRIDGWMPNHVRTRLVEKAKARLSEYDMTGLERPDIQAGTVGPDARSLGAACLPLSERYLVEL